jgi:hypothetical protein
VSDNLINSLQLSMNLILLDINIVFKFDLSLIGTCHLFNIIMFAIIKIQFVVEHLYLLLQYFTLTLLYINVIFEFLLHTIHQSALHSIIVISMVVFS